MTFTMSFCRLIQLKACKTTSPWRHPKALIIDLRLSELKLKLSTAPQYLLELVRGQPKGQVVIIDEIQKIPELLSLVHILIEEKKVGFSS